MRGSEGRMKDGMSCVEAGVNHKSADYVFI
jgi:hypothetical protein